MPSVLTHMGLEAFQELQNLDQKLTKAIGRKKLPEGGYLDTEWIDRQSPEIVKLIRQLDSYLCCKMIDSTGQHSESYYRARRAGYALRTGESDSWGTLTSVYISIDGKWRFCFG